MPPKLSLADSPRAARHHWWASPQPPWGSSQFSGSWWTAAASCAPQKSCPEPGCQLRARWLLSLQKNSENNCHSTASKAFLPSPAARKVARCGWLTKRCFPQTSSKHILFTDKYITLFFNSALSPILLSDSSCLAYQPNILDSWLQCCHRALKSWKLSLMQKFCHTSWNQVKVPCCLLPSPLSSSSPRSSFAEASAKFQECLSTAGLSLRRQGRMCRHWW